MEEYNAFISYSHKDKSWAKWFKHRLDTFRNKDVSSVKYPLRRIFLDDYNLPIDELKKKGLPDNLDKSKYLICICSKNYTSEWCKLEVSHFKKVCESRGVDWNDYIIPICIGSTECLPDSIKNIKAAVIKSFLSFTRKELALALIASKILEIDNPDKIYGYLKRRLHVKKTLSMIVGILIMALVIFVYEFSRTKSIIYADYVEGHYIQGEQTEWFEGIFHLSPEEWKKAISSWRFEYKRIPIGQPQAGRWQLRKVVHINSCGYPSEIEYQTSPFVRYSIFEIKYQYIDNQYRPERLECYNEYGLLQRIIQISGDNLDKIDYKDSRTDISYNGQSMSQFYNPLFERLGNKYCNITHLDLTRDTNGNILCVFFKSYNGKGSIPFSDTRGSYGMRFERDSIARIIRTYYLTDVKIGDREIPYHLFRYFIDYSYEGGLMRRLKIKEAESFLPKNGGGVISHGIFGMDFNTNDTIREIKKYSYIDTTGNYICELLENGLVYDWYICDCKGWATNGKPLNQKNKKSTMARYNKDGTQNYILICDTITNKVKYIKSFKYNSYRQKIEEQLSDTGGNLISTSTFKYQNKQLMSIVIDSGGIKCKTKYKRDRLGRVIEISSVDRNNNLIDGFTYSTTDPVDGFEKSSLEKLANDMRGRTIDSIYSPLHDSYFMMYGSYSKRTFLYDDMGNIEKIYYYRANGDCILIIKEDILEDGFVPDSELYLTNRDKQILPYKSQFYSNDVLLPFIKTMLLTTDDL